VHANTHSYRKKYKFVRGAVVSGSSWPESSNQPKVALNSYGKSPAEAIMKETVQRWPLGHGTGTSGLKKGVRIQRKTSTL